MSTSHDVSPLPPQSQSSLSFTQGFLLGQLSIVILVGAFIKFFIFGDIPSADSTAASRALARRNRTLAHKRSVSLTALNGSPQHLRRKRSSVLRNPPPSTTATILAKTYYNVDSHQPESLDWFNVLIAQTIAQFRSDAHDDDAILTSLNTVLNGPHKPDFLAEIKVTEISLGEDFPIFSNCRVNPVDEDGAGSGAAGPTGEGRLQARMDVDLSDFITLGVETKMVLNYPKPRTAILPVALAVSVVRFSGTLSISFLPSSLSPTTPSGNGTGSASGSGGSPSPTTLSFAFLDDYRLDLSIRSLVGSRSRLQDVPKIAQLVEARLHSWFDDRCVEPRFQQIVLPSLWPRKRNTRGGGGGGGEKEDGVGGGKEGERECREEARRELEAEAEAEARAERERVEEGLRWRRRRGEGGGYGMPGTMVA